MFEIDYPQGATLLSRDEMVGLIPTNIITRAELDRWEQDNINEAILWLSNSKPKNIFSENFIRLLHKKMFCNVWKWAGKFRQTEKNIGVMPYMISIELKKLFDDAQYWMANKTFSGDEFAARFHHRLVSIHPFPNGNGRHARLTADTILENIFDEPPFTWGSADLIKTDNDREKYIESLVSADKGNYDKLIKFARS